MKFRLLAIRPHQNCKKRFLKVLVAGQPYFFYQGYSILEDRIDPSAATSNYVSLYKLKSGATIEISAVVGKNGSGKSSLIELMYAVIYNVSFAAELIPTHDEDGKKMVFEQGVCASLYYQHETDFYRLQCDEGQINLFLQSGTDSNFQELSKGTSSFNKFLKLFFYTVGVSYSHYSLNAMHESRWLKHVFHKNDGYQTPLVINPFRDNGQISVNSEEYLTLTRIAANLLTIQGKRNELYNELAPNKFVTHLRFKLNRDKANFGNLGDVGPIIKEYKGQIIESLIMHFPNIGKAVRANERSKYVDVATDYLCIKLYNITDRYKPYKVSTFRFIEKEQKLEGKRTTYSTYRFSKARLNKLLIKIKSHPSHITFKFFQAINFLMHVDFYVAQVDKLVLLPDLAKAVNTFAKRSNQELINVIPPSFFNIDIKFGSKGYLQTLSSGEKQKIYSSASWVYHLMNLSSVREDRGVGYIKYRLINIVFDEIELYYHPELQRTFIKDFIDTLNRIPLRREIYINCVFVTHSPFILSDIPNVNILFLNKEGLPDPLAISSHTLAANIHELLKNSFFLDEGPMGAHAQMQIKSLMEFLDSDQLNSNEWNQLDAKKFIDLIGESLVQSSLRSMYVRKFFDEQSRTFLEMEIERLQNKLHANKKKNDSNRYYKGKRAY